MRALFGCLALAVSAALATAAFADDGPSAPAPDKSQFTVFDPTPDADLRAFCADRPTKANGACTVDAGHWQIESDLYNVTRQAGGGVTTTTELFTNPTVKLGVTNTLDLELNIAPDEQVTTHDSATGITTRANGVSDLFLRAKWNLLGDDSGNVSIALFPYVKIPTAPRSTGNGAVEGGVILPINFTLPQGWSLAIDPEADALLNSSGSGRHANLTTPISLGYQASKTVTVFAELWGDVNFDPAGTTTQTSFDLAAAWVPAKAPNFQLDGGFNFGLDHNTPGLQAYVGVSQRF